MATTAMHNPGILLPPRAAQSSSSTSSYTSGSPDGSASSASSTSSSLTSLSDLASHSSASTSKPSPYSSATSPRRIRFAPLPDPRRAVLITDDGDEVYIPVPDDNIFSTSLLLPHSPLAMSMTISSPHAEACDPDPPPLNDDGPAASSASSTNGSYLSSNSSSSASTTSNPKTGPSDYSPMSSVGSSPVIRDTTALPPVGKSASAPTAPPTAWLKPRAMNLLHPFRHASTPSSPVSSSHSLTPTSSIDNSASTRTPDTKGKSIRPTRKVLSLTTEEILTLGTINLFRTSSRDSTASSSTAINTTPGWALKRWSSSSINPSNGSLAKIQSTQSHKSKSLFSLGGSGSSTSSLSSHAESKSTVAKPKPPASKPFNRHKGTRMLNGRVYGSQRAAALAANPFATARDEEPAFVEWGYGGMGSVKGAKSAGVASGGVNWERLQGGPAVKEAVGVGAAGEGGDGEDDDGSGMGWVKKRREERERKERERLAALEAAEKEQAPELSESNLSTPTPTRTSTMDGLKVPQTTPAENANDVATVAGFVLDEAITDEPGAISPSLESAATIVPSSYPSVHPMEEVKGEADHSSTPSGLMVASRSKESLKEIKADENSEEAQQPQEHAPDIVPVPAWSGKHLHLHHSGSYRRHTRKLSNPGLTTTPSSAEGTNGDVMPSGIVENASASTSKVENHLDENDASSSSSASSDSEDEGLGSDEDEEDEEEDEEEKARHEARRKTALGAGVEKVMRHKE